ncbi:MAG: hypothetical protein PVI97_12735 [Candidatus Thiodiazotropha sp.]|jgi:hypothetical protein
MEGEKMAYQVANRVVNDSPRIEFSGDDEGVLFIISASEEMDIIDSGSRRLVIAPGGGLRINTLPPLSTAPPGIKTHNLVIDDAGNVYIDDLGGKRPPESPKIG